jgi:2-polyprenyl-6-methoxyphenol hydroxylase-like FAD-dependent oxidoreductase
MSPVGGVGINYAIMDAVVAANILTGPLKAGHVQLSDLAKVQRKRELPTRIIQMFQAFVQNQVLAKALKSNKPFTLSPAFSFLLNIPGLRTLPARLVAFGLWPAHVKA